MISFTACAAQPFKTWINEAAINLANFTSQRNGGRAFSLFERGHACGSPLQFRICRKKGTLVECQNKLSCKMLTEIQLSLSVGIAFYFIIDLTVFVRDCCKAEKVNWGWLRNTAFPVCKCLTSVYLFCCRHNQQEFSDEICS